MVDYVTDNTHQAVAATGQQVLVLAPNSAATQTGYVGSRIAKGNKTITVIISNVTAVGVSAGGTVSVYGSNDPKVASSTADATAIWSLITAVVASATTVTTASFFHTADTTPWLYYKAVTGVNASTNTNTVAVSF